MEAWGNKDVTYTDDCLLCALIFIVTHFLWAIPYCIMRTYLRQEIRKAKNLKEENIVMDFLCILFCSCCTIAQEAHELGAKNTKKG